MKTLIKGVLALLLTMVLLAAVPAQAEQNNILLFDGKLTQWGMDSSQQVAAIGDVLYVARSSGLYAYHVGDDAPKQLMDLFKTDLTGAALQESGSRPAAGWLFSGGGKLYSLDLFGGTLWRFDQDAAAFVKEASFDPATARENEQYMYSGFCMEGDDIYYIAADTKSPIRNLMRLDLAGGKNELVRSGIQLVVPYAPGVLLVGRDTMSSMGSLALLDTKTGSLEEKLALTGDCRELQYDPATDTIYLSRKGEIYASHAFNKPEAVARIPILSPASNGALLAGGYLAFPYDDGVRIFSTDPKALTDMPLKIAGPTDGLPMEDFSAANPNVTTFSFIDVHSKTTMDLVMHMMGGDSAADVYAIYLSGYNLDALYEKGYFASLSDSEFIQKTVSAMYPFVKDALMRGGEIIALPFYTRYHTYNYNPRAFEAVGLSEKDVPQTYGELLAFIKKWGEAYQDQYPSMSLFGYGADPGLYKRIVAQSVIEDRMYTCLKRSEPISYDTPEMRALLETLTATDFSAIDPLMPESNPNEYNTPDDWPKQLFHLSGAGTQTAYIDFFSYMPLKLFEGEQPVVMAEIQALFINPYTKNYDTALKFVEFSADNLSVTMRADLMPGENDPVYSSYMIDTLARYEEEISMTEKALKEAKEEDKRNLQDRLESLRQEYDQQKRNAWLVSEQSLAAFRALDGYFMLKKPNPLFASDELIDLFYNRFQDGQISVDQFLKELDRKLKMIELED